MKTDPLAVLRNRRSAKWRTYPADVLPLTVAEMDFALAPPVADALRAAVDASDTGYSAAVPELGQAVAGFAAAALGLAGRPGSVTAVTDVGVGVVELLRVLTGPGDVVAFSPPVYPPFFDWVPEAGGRAPRGPARAHRRTAGAWTWPRSRPRSPPTRRSTCCATRTTRSAGCTAAAELTALVRLARAVRVTMVSDEIHAPLVLPGATFTPLLTVPGAAELAISVVSASKAFNLAGLKCAAVVTASAGDGRGGRPLPAGRPLAHRPLRRASPPSPPSATAPTGWTTCSARWTPAAPSSARCSATACR